MSLVCLINSAAVCLINSTDCFDEISTVSDGLLSTGSVSGCTTEPEVSCLFTFWVAGEVKAGGIFGALTFLPFFGAGFPFSFDDFSEEFLGLHESFRIDAPTSLNFPSFFEFWPFFDDLERPRSGNASSLNLTIRSSFGLSEVSSFRNISFRFSNDEFRRRNLETSCGW